MEETQQVVDISKRILRWVIHLLVDHWEFDTSNQQFQWLSMCSGMTWSGWIYNTVSSAPQQVSDRNASQPGEVRIVLCC